VEAEDFLDRNICAFAVCSATLRDWKVKPLTQAHRHGSVLSVFQRELLKNGSHATSSLKTSAAKAKDMLRICTRSQFHICSTKQKILTDSRDIMVSQWHGGATWQGKPRVSEVHQNMLSLDSPRTSPRHESQSMTSASWPDPVLTQLFSWKFLTCMHLQVLNRNCRGHPGKDLRENRASNFITDFLLILVDSIRPRPRYGLKNVWNIRVRLHRLDTI
jgi:hypothetical protein